MIKNKFLKVIIIIIIVVFISAYYISNSGYYEYHMQQKTVLTNDKIKEFEEDVKNGKNIDEKIYLEDMDKDYSNNISNIIYKISTDGTKVTRKIIKKLFKKLSYLVED